MNIAPITIHKRAGNQPNQIPASIGPTIGPAAAIAEKCCPRRRDGFAGTKSTPSFIWHAGVGE